jgi:hypothetical protein
MDHGTGIVEKLRDLTITPIGRVVAIEQGRIIEEELAMESAQVGDH